MKSGWKPKMTGPRQAAYIVIRAGREMAEREVVLEMKRLFGWNNKRAITPLIRACGIEPRYYLPHGNKDYERLERVVSSISSAGKKTYKYRPRAEFTALMIPKKLVCEDLEIVVA